MAYAIADLAYLVTDGRVELWTCRLSTDAPAGNNNQIDLFIYWDGREVTSYQSERGAFVDFITDQKNRRSEKRRRIWSSPLCVSATLALLLTLLIDNRCTDCGVPTLQAPIR